LTAVKGSLSLVSVLLVEDSLPLRARLRELVERIDGLRVVDEVASVSEALSAVERQGPDVVLLDVSLPDGSGIDLLRAIRPLSPRPAVIVLTANTDPIYRKTCLEAGADYFFTKLRPLRDMESLLSRFGRNPA
jgi:DNA-binding NarL/FixJ family response regulator